MRVTYLLTSFLCGFSAVTAVLLLAYDLVTVSNRLILKIKTYWHFVRLLAGDDFKRRSGPSQSLRAGAVGVEVIPAVVILNLH